jgi:hypothetical protein
MTRRLFEATNPVSRVFLTLEHLEPRLAPGALIFSSSALMPLGPALPPPAQPELEMCSWNWPESDREPSLPVKKAGSDSPCSPIRVETATILSAGSVTVPAATGAVFNHLPSIRSYPSQMNPPPITAPRVGKQVMAEHSSTPTAAPLHPIRRQALVGAATTVAVAPVDPKTVSVRVEHCGGQGVRSSELLSYEGTVGSPSTADQVLDVAAGQGAEIGKVYAAGHRGASPSLTFTTSMPNRPGFLCTAMLFAQPAPHPAACKNNGVEASPDGSVYLSQTCDDGTSSVHRVRNLTVEASWQLSLPGGSLTLEDIARSPTGDIFVTGKAHDPGSFAHPNTFVARWNAPLDQLVWSRVVDFSDESGGLSVDADAVNNVYVGGATNDGVVISNTTFRLEPAGQNIMWAYSVTDNGPEAPHPGNGMHGAKYLGSALFTTGSYQSNTHNPGGHLSSLVVKWTPATGVPLHYAQLVWIAGLDHTGQDIAADSAGNAYKAGATGNASDRDGRVDKFDSTGVWAASDWIGGTGTQDAALAIDLVTNSPSSGVIHGGRTDSAALNYTPNGCLQSYGGGTDGYYGIFSQPLGP